MAGAGVGAEQMIEAGFIHEHEHDPKFPSIHGLVDQLDPEERPRIASFLREGSLTLVSGGYVDDALDPSKSDIAPRSVYSDGSFQWPAYAAYYVERYGMGLPELFLQWIRNWNYTPRPWDSGLPSF